MAKKKKERRYIQNLRTSGTTAPDENIVVHDGEIALSMDNKNPRIFFKKNNGEYASFVSEQQLLSTEFAIAKALNELDTRMRYMEESDFF